MPRELAQLLIEEGAVDAEGVERALARQREVGGALDTALLELGLVDEGRLTALLSRAADLPAAPLSAYEAIDARARRVFPSKVAERHGLAPFALDGRELSLVATWPIDLGLLDEISFMLSLHLTPHVGPEWRVRSLIQRLYGGALAPRLARLVQSGGGAVVGLASAPCPAPAEPEIPIDVAPEAGGPAAPIATPPGSAARAAPFGRPIGFTGFAREAGEPLEPLAAALAQAAEALDLPWEEALSPVAAAPLLPPPHPLEGEGPPDAAAESAPPAAPPPPPAPRPLDRSAPPRWKMAQARAVLADAITRDEVVLTALRYARDFFQFVAVFAVTRDVVAGHDALGAEEGLREVCRSVAIYAEDPGIFRTAIATSAPYLGPVSREAAGSVAVLDGLGRGSPRTALVYPILLRDRPVCILYADNADAPVSARRLGDLLLFLSTVGGGFERIIRSRKAAPRPPASLEQAPRPEAWTTVEASEVERPAELPIEAFPEAATAAEPAPELMAAVDALPEPPPAPTPDPTAPTWLDGPPVPAAGPALTGLAAGEPAPPAVAEPPAEVPAPPSPEPALAPTALETPPAPTAPVEPPPAEPAPEPPAQVSIPEPPAPAPPEVELAPAVATPEPVAPPPPAAPLDREPVPPPGPAAPPPTPPRAASDLADLEEAFFSSVPGTLSEAFEAPLAALPSPVVVTPASSPFAEAPTAATPGPAGPPAPTPAAPPEVPPEITAAFGDAPAPPPAPPAPPAAGPLEPGALVGRFLMSPRGSEERGELLAALIERADEVAAILCDQLPGPLEVAPDALSRTPAAEQGPVLAAVAALGPAAVRPLLGLLTDAEPGRRRAAAALLGQAGDASAFVALADRTFDPDPRVAEAARAALALHRRDPAMKPVPQRLRRALLSGLGEQAAAGARAIGALRDAESIPVLIQALEGVDPGTAAAAAEALGAITLQRHGTVARKWLMWWKENRGRGRAEWLFGALTSEDREVRLAAAFELREVAASPVTYSADMPPVEREAAARAWAVWMARGGHRV